MSMHGNTYQKLTPDRKLNLFLFEAERFLTSIIGYSKLLSVDAQRPPLEDALPPAFSHSLETIQQTGSKLAQRLHDIEVPDEVNPDRDALIHEALTTIIYESPTPLSILGTGCSVLKQAVQQSDLRADLPPRFTENLDMLQTAVTRLTDIRQELVKSMK